MKIVVVAAMLVAAAPPALGACNADLLKVVDWQIGESQISLLPYRIEATVRYEGSRPFRMIHAGVMLDDALGKNLGQVNLGEDQKAAPGDEIVVDGQVSVSKRLGAVAREDVAPRACVWSIVYDDGTVERFDR
jgi:hypothetical protein